MKQETKERGIVTSSEIEGDAQTIASWASQIRYLLLAADCIENGSQPIDRQEVVDCAGYLRATAEDISMKVAQAADSLCNDCRRLA